MEPKIAQFINKGMQQDYSISKASNEFAFKNHNIRITTRGENSLLTVTNEKSNKIIIDEINNKIGLTTNPVGFTLNKEDKLLTLNNSDSIFTFLLMYLDSVGAWRSIILTTELGVSQYSIPSKTYYAIPVITGMKENGTSVFVAVTTSDTVFSIADNVAGSYPGFRDICIAKVSIEDYYVQYELSSNSPSLNNVTWDKNNKIIFFVDTNEYQNISTTTHVLFGSVLIERNTTLLHDICVGVSSETENEYRVICDKDNIQNFTTKPIIIGKPLELKGVVLGYSKTKDDIVLFTTDGEKDYIYTIELNSDTYKLNLLYSGTLGFSLDSPIETLYNYESEKVQKVYWVDGINRPRVINIKGRIQENNNSQFDFNPIATTPEVVIKKSYTGAGLFPSGTIQYVITYYNNFMQESSPVYISPLQYLSDVDKGASTEDTVSCSFNIEVSNLDPNWDNIRIYSIIRSSLDGTALGYLVAEEPLVVEDEDSIITIVDNGTNQEAIDVTNFLFNNDDFIPSTLARKADRLFFGDITTLNLSSLDENTETAIRNACTLTWQNKSKNLASPEYNSLYYYESQLKQPENNIKGFKYGETYRFALQFQNNRGIWGEPIYLTDFKNTNYPNYNTVPSIKAELNLSNISSFIESENITNVRLLRAEIDDNNRTIVAQGILSPTVYNMSERVNNTCFNINSWTQRFTGFDANLRNVNWKKGDPSLYYNKEVPFDTVTGREYDLKETSTAKDVSSTTLNTPAKAKVIGFNGTIEYTYASDYGAMHLVSSYLSIELLNENSLLIDTITYNYYTGIISRIYGRAKNKDKYIKKVNNAYAEFNAQLQTYKVSKVDVDGVLDFLKSEYPTITSISNFEEGDHLLSNASLPITQEELLIALVNCENTQSAEPLNSLKNTISISLSSVTTSSIKSFVNDSELRNQYFTDAITVSMFSPDINKVYSEDLKFRVIGYAELQNNISSFNISVDTAKQKGAMSEFGFNDFNTKNYLYSHYLWYSPNIRKDESEFTYGFPWIGLWQQSGSLSNHPEEDILKRKVIGNLWYCAPTQYQFLNDEIEWTGNGISTIKKFVDSPIDIAGKIYKGNYNYALLPYNTNGFTYYYSPKSNTSTFEDVESSSREELIPYAYNTCNIKFNSTEHAVFKLNKDSNNKLVCLPGYDTNISGYSNIIYSTGELIQYENSIKPETEKCYNYPFLFPLDTRTEKAPAGLELETKGGQYNTNVEVPILNNTYVIVAFFNWEDAESLRQTNLAAYNHLQNSIIKNNIFPSNKNYLSPEFLPLIKFLSQYCYYGLYKINSVSGTILNCNLVSKEYKTLNNFIDYYADKYFIGAGGGIPGFPNAIVYSGGNCKISSTSDDDYGGVAFPYLEDVRKSTDIYSGLINLDLPTRFSDHLASNKCILIGEFYRDLINQYGGTSPTALANTKYVVCSETYPITSDTITIDNTYGDTYFQRWDCLRTYPTTEEDINSVVDIVSVMVESYTNLDGRYDSNRGRLDVHNSRPTNMNLLNKAYSQTNNFFTIYDLDDRLKNSNFKNCYTWSLGKKNSELVDNWTKGLMVNVNPVDGAKGKITKLQLWKDYLLVFQEKGIARIHYNDQTTISSVEGIPVEIANSTKVSGHNYLSEAVGCHNKWTIVPTESGIYFVDSINKAINIFNGNVVNLSYNKAFKDWSTENLNSTVWTPVSNEGYYASFDFKNRDYYLTNQEHCLCFSEELQSFSSFYDYNKSPIMFNFKDKFLAIQNVYNGAYIWEQFAGEGYCNFYGEQKDYSVEYNINTDPISDKVFTNLEYRAYVDNSDDTFDKLEVSNEYQHGESNPNRRTRHVYPNAERKFRIWRTDIPRDTNSRRGLDRIRSPWMKLKLTKNTNTNNKMNFHDLLVKYYE